VTDPRSTFLAMLYSQPLRQADAIVLLAGEDGMARAEVALQLFKQHAAPTIIVTGGKDDGVRWFGADRLAGWLMGQGVAPGRITTDTGSENTREQAAQVADITAGPILLIASAYHLPRAFLTFAPALDARITPVAATPPWCEAPHGMTETRLDLLATELAKIEEYRALGHVATYEAGIAYLTAWESNGTAEKAA